MSPSHAVSPGRTRGPHGKERGKGHGGASRPSSRRVSNVQVVVVPGVNDGAELMRTPVVGSSGIPVFSAGFCPARLYASPEALSASSFSDDPDAAAAVIELIRVPGGFRRRTAQSPPANCRRVLHRRWLRFSARLHVRGLPAVPGWHRHDAPFIDEWNGAPICSRGRPRIWKADPWRTLPAERRSPAFCAPFESSR